MNLHFSKYQATGNDFVLVDNRELKHAFSVAEIEKICDRRFGVGGDGLILIENDAYSDFKMVYYNSDGSQSLCGNGCRSAIDFASHLGLIKDKTTFSAFDGLHQGHRLPSGIIHLQMADVHEVKRMGENYFINTGSPHVVKFVSDIKNYPVIDEGRSIRYSENFKPAGTNANFAELKENNTISLRTYERGVEDETFSCGTGATAAALAASLHGYTSPVSIEVRGGHLSVEFKTSHTDTFHDIFLIGPAKMVFQGQMEL
jgi:diaminopimelate epimerase